MSINNGKCLVKVPSFSLGCREMLCLVLCVDIQQVSELSGVQVLKQGAVHKLIFSAVTDAHEGRYTFRAKGAESEAVLTVAGVCSYECPASVVETKPEFIFKILSVLFLFYQQESPKSAIFKCCTQKLPNLYCKQIEIETVEITSQSILTLLPRPSGSGSLCAGLAGGPTCDCEGRSDSCR